MLGNITKYAQNLAKGGVSIYLTTDAQTGSKFNCTPYKVTWESNTPMRELLPAATVRNIKDKELELSAFISEQIAVSGIYPFLTPEEIALSALVDDMLSDPELNRLQSNTEYYRASGVEVPVLDDSDIRMIKRTQPATREIASAEARIDRSSHPEFFESVQERQMREMSEALNRLTAASAKIKIDAWKFDPRPQCMWVKRTKPNGQVSTHILTVDSEGYACCDCESKKIRPREQCVHELARTEEIARRERE